MKISVLGAGAWGTAMAAHTSLAHSTLLWARKPEQAAAIAQSGENARYLPGIALPQQLQSTADLDEALQHAAGPRGLLVLASPLAGLRQQCLDVAAQIRSRHLDIHHVVWLCKGLEEGTAALPHQIAAQTFAGLKVACGALSGPSFAKEVALSLPCALTIAAQDARLCALVQQAFHHHAMRVYASDDVIGVEVGGAVKNILAIATGACDGLGMGANARAALVTRGLAEMTRLGVALGGRAETFMGLTGMGDLILTATGDLSRNRTVGMGLAQGKTLPQILEALGHVAEGVRCAKTVRDLARAKHIEMPITEAVCAVLFEDMPLRDAMLGLLRRDAKSE